MNEKAPDPVDQAKRNKRLALIHVGVAVAVLVVFVLNTVLK